MREQSKLVRQWMALATIAFTLATSAQAYQLGGRDSNADLFNASDVTSPLTSSSYKDSPYRPSGSKEEALERLVQELVKRANAKEKDKEVAKLRTEYGALLLQREQFKQEKAKTDKARKRDLKAKEAKAIEARDRAGSARMGQVRAVGTPNLDKATPECGGPQIQGKVAEVKKVSKGVGAITEHIKKGISALYEEDAKKRRDQVKDMVAKAREDFLKGIGWDKQKKKLEDKLKDAKDKETYGNNPMALYGLYNSGNKSVKKYYQKAIDFMKKSNMEAALAFFDNLEKRLDEAAQEQDLQRRVKLVTDQIAQSATEWKSAAEEPLLSAGSLAAQVCPQMRDHVWGGERAPSAPNFGGLEARVMQVAVQAVPQVPPASMNEAAAQQQVNAQAQQAFAQQVAQGLRKLNKKLEASQCRGNPSATVNEAIGNVDNAIAQISSQPEPSLIPETTARAMTTLQEEFNKGISAVDKAVGYCSAFASAKKFLDKERERFEGLARQNGGGGPEGLAAAVPRGGARGGAPVPGAVGHGGGPI